MIFVEKEHAYIPPISVQSAIDKLKAAYKMEQLCAYLSNKPKENFTNPVKLIEFDLGGYVTKVCPIVDDALKTENLSLIGNHFSSFLKHADFTKADWQKVINGTMLSRNFHFRGSDDVQVSSQCVFEYITEESTDVLSSKVVFSIFVKK